MLFGALADDETRIAPEKNLVIVFKDRKITITERHIVLHTFDENLQVTGEAKYTHGQFKRRMFEGHEGQIIHWG